MVRQKNYILYQQIITIRTLICRFTESLIRIPVQLHATISEPSTTAPGNIPWPPSLCKRHSCLWFWNAESPRKRSCRTTSTAWCDARPPPNATIPTELSTRCSRNLKTKSCSSFGDRTDGGRDLGNTLPGSPRSSRGELLHGECYTSVVYKVIGCVPFARFLAFNNEAARRFCVVIISSCHMWAYRDIPHLFDTVDERFTSQL